MREGVRVAAVVTLLCLVAADVGIHVGRDFEASPSYPTEQWGGRRPEPREEVPTFGARDTLPFDLWTAAQGISAFVVAAFTGCLVAVALRQASITTQQTEIASRQADVADRQLRLTEDLERPLVLLARLGWRIEGWRHQNSRSRFPDVEVELANFGRGVAVVGHCRIAMLIGVNQPERMPFGENYSAALMLDKRGKRSLVTYVTYYRSSQGLTSQSEPWSIPLNGVELTPVQVEEVLTGDQTVWIDAVAYYEDVGGKGCETHFRYVYDRDADFFRPDAGASECNRHT